MSGQSVERRVEVNSEGGLHFRVASLFVSCAERFSSEICVVKGEQKVNGKYEESYCGQARDVLNVNN